MVDIKRIVADYLRADAAVIAVGQRVVGRTPTSQTGGTARPWIRVTLLNAQSLASSPVDHLLPYLLQFDSYAGEEGGQPEAMDIAIATRAALAAMSGVHEGAVVTRVAFTGMNESVDLDIEPGRERVILTAQIHAHPAS